MATTTQDQKNKGFGLALSWAASCLVAICVFVMLRRQHWLVDASVMVVAAIFSAAEIGGAVHAVLPLATPLKPKLPGMAPLAFGTAIGSFAAIVNVLSGGFFGIGGGVGAVTALYLVTFVGYQNSLNKLRS